MAKVIFVDEADVNALVCASAQMEMRVFDRLPKCVRDVLNEAPVGVRPSSLIKHPNNVALIERDPTDFARRLKRHLRLLAREKASV